MPAPIDHSGRGPSAAGLRLRGLVVLVVIAAVVAGYLWYVNRPPSGQEDFTVLTTSAGDALNTQTQVRMRGMVIGTVTDVQQDSSGTVRIRMRVDKARFAELRQPLQTRFVSSNFFSSTAMDLVPGDGMPIESGQVIDLKTGVGDYTVTTLISQAGNTIVGSLTPQLTETIKRGSRLLAGVAPAATAGLELVRALREAQARYPLAIGRFLNSVQTTLNTAVPSAREVLSGLYDITSIPIFKNAEQSQWYLDTFHSLAGFIGDQGIARVLNTLDLALPAFDVVGDYLGPLNYAMRNVDADQIAELIKRLDRAIPSVNGRPTIETSLTLIPGLAAATRGGQR